MVPENPLQLPELVVAARLDLDLDVGDLMFKPCCPRFQQWEYVFENDVWFSNPLWHIHLGCVIMWIVKLDSDD